MKRFLLIIVSYILGSIIYRLFLTKTGTLIHFDHFHDVKTFFAYLIGSQAAFMMDLYFWAIVFFIYTAFTIMKNQTSHG